jgi:hypothetical protein
MGNLRTQHPGLRDSGHADRLRAYKVIVDGNTAGEIRNGETMEFPISSGQHDLLFKNDWCGSKTTQFTTGDREVRTFDAKKLSGAETAGGAVGTHSSRAVHGLSSVNSVKRRQQPSPSRGDEVHYQTNTIVSCYLVRSGPGREPFEIPN